MKRSKSCFDEYLMMQTNEDYHVERTRSELTDEYDQHSYKSIFLFKFFFELNLDSFKSI